MKRGSSRSDLCLRSMIGAGLRGTNERWDGLALGGSVLPMVQTA
jgi:hypothetical protein